MNIDVISQAIVSSFNAEDDAVFNKETNNMLFMINNDEYMFSCVKRPYIVAKSLYFMLTNEHLTEDEQISCIRLTYYCLLANYVKNSESIPGTQEYEDYILGCKLALVLLYLQPYYITFSIIAGEALYVNAKTQVRNQILLFGGILKETNGKYENYPVEDVINDYFIEIFKDINEDLPCGTNLATIKKECNSVIKNIECRISINFKERDFDEFDLW